MRQKYCNSECSHKASLFNNAEQKTCQYCGEIFEKSSNVNGGRFGNRKYCSRICTAKGIIEEKTKNRLFNKINQRTCQYCGKIFTIRYGRDRKKFNKQQYCSHECHCKAKIEKRLSDTTKQTTCLQCNKTFNKKFKDNRQRYCSRECAYNAEVGRGRPRRNKCLYCHKTFYTTPCRIGKYCSQKCLGEYRKQHYPESMRQKISIARSKHKAPLKDTSIEVKIQKGLADAYIPFRKHKCFKMLDNTYHQVDIFVEPNIAIELDGEYFHFDKTKNLSRDNLVDESLIKLHGMIVLRFWGYYIKNEESFKTIMKQIKEIVYLRQMMLRIGEKMTSILEDSELQQLRKERVAQLVLEQ